MDVETANATERFDQVVMACHSDQSLALLADASPRRNLDVGAASAASPNRVVLHTDARLMPRHRRAWAAWNYLGTPQGETSRPVAVSYWLNCLQPLPFKTPLIVTLNPPFEPEPRHVLGRFDYSHPLVKSAAVTAQHLFANIQGERGTWYAGAWLGHGFHEDGLASAHAVARGIESRAAMRTAELAAA